MGSYIWSSSDRLRTKQKHKGTRHLGEWRLHSPAWLVSRISWPPPLKSLVSFPHAGSASAIGPQDHSVPALWDPRGGESKLVTWKQEPPRRGWMGETKIKWAVLSTSPSSLTSRASFLSIWCWIILCYGGWWSSCALYGVEQPPWPLPAGCP